jgi:hypothetical protein
LLFKSGCCSKVVVVQKWLLFKSGCCSKVVVVQEWSLFRGGCCSKVVVAQKWSLFRGWSFKITINIEKLGITLAVIDRCLEVVVNTGLTVLINKILKFVSYNFFFINFRLKPKLLTTKSNTSLRLEPSSPSPSF